MQTARLAGSISFQCQGNTTLRAVSGSVTASGLETVIRYITLDIIIAKQQLTIKFRRLTTDGKKVTSHKRHFRFQA
jgi:hypothetical protein